DIIDNAIVIFLENKECWNNYIGRETKKSNEGHKSSYDTLNKEKYMDMVKMFKDHQEIYENREKYKNIKIKNNDKSWKKVYKEIKEYLEVYCGICNNESKTFPYEETFEESKRFGEIEQYIIDIFKDGNHNSIKDLVDHEKSCENP
ncbi:hypothetical protein RhiirA4_486639, partial [Rhizophagus irregularis]